MQYEKRMVLPLDGNPDIEFFTKDGTLVAKGYERVVIGERGPYIEFADASIVRDSIHIPDDQKWRLLPKYAFVYYNEWRTKDNSNVKLYEQRKTVKYADYKVGFWYVSPFELTTLEYPVLIKPLEKGNDGHV